MATKIKMKTLKVQTIYPAFMGEVNECGIGAPCVFVRLAGCNLRCYEKTRGCLCDTPEALAMTSGEQMSVGDIVQAVLPIGRNVVCLTGGEPLLQDVTELLTELTAWGNKVVVETNGSVSIKKYLNIPNVSFVVDVKASSTGEQEKMLESNYKLMRKCDFVKFVIDTDDDYKEMLKWVVSHGSSYKGNIGVGLFWGSKMPYQELMTRLHRDDVYAYLNMQNHKMACLYDREKDSLSDLIIPKTL